jgi:signal transduction protein with GAF and PtsI domain
MTPLPDHPTAENWLAFLREVLTEFHCVTGTLHRLDPADQLLKLVTCERIPEVLIPVIQTIPIGKGVAGAAAERKAPVEICNLQTDTSGVAKPDAKKTQVQGSLAVPVLTAAGDLRGTLGIGKMEAYDFSDAEKASLMAIAQSIADKL